VLLAAAVCNKSGKGEYLHHHRSPCRQFCCFHTDSLLFTDSLFASINFRLGNYHCQIEVGLLIVNG